jgi:hypothetical protein
MCVLDFYQSRLGAADYALIQAVRLQSICNAGGVSPFRK